MASRSFSADVGAATAVRRSGEGLAEGEAGTLDSGSPMRGPLTLPAVAQIPEPGDPHSRPAAGGPRYSSASVVFVSEVPLSGDFYTPRWGAGAAVAGDRVYLFGGYVWFHGAERFHDDFYEIDIRLGIIRRIPAAPSDGSRPCARFGVSLVASDTGDASLYLFGGRDANFCFADLWQFSLVTQTWKLIIPRGRGPGPAPRSWHSASICQGKMYICGGWSQAKEVCADVWCYDTADCTWEFFCGEAPMSQTAENVGTAAAVSQPSGHVSLDGSTRSTTPDAFSVEGRAYHQSIIWQKGLYIYGGAARRSVLASSDIWRLDLETREWKLVPTVGPSPGKRVSAAGVLVGNSWILHGGLSSIPAGDGVPTSDVFLLDLETFRWYKKAEICISPGGSNGLNPASTQHFAVDLRMARYGHSGVCGPDMIPIFLGGADSFASAQSNVVWQLEFIQSLVQANHLASELDTSRQIRRQTIECIAKLQRTVDTLANRLRQEEQNAAFFRSRYEEVLSRGELAEQRAQILQGQLVSLNARLTDVEPTIELLRSFAMSMVGASSTKSAMPTRHATPMSSYKAVDSIPPASMSGCLSQTATLFPVKSDDPAWPSITPTIHHDDPAVSSGAEAETGTLSSLAPQPLI